MEHLGNILVVKMKFFVKNLSCDKLLISFICDVWVRQK